MLSIHIITTHIYGIFIRVLKTQLFITWLEDVVGSYMQMIMVNVDDTTLSWNVYTLI